MHDSKVPCLYHLFYCGKGVIFHVLKCTFVPFLPAPPSCTYEVSIFRATGGWSECGMHDYCLLYLKRGVVLHVISSCAQVPRGCYTPYTAVLSATTPCTLVDVDAGAAANRIMRNSWLHCILFHMRLPTGNRYPIYTVILSRLLRYGPQSDSILEARTPHVRTAPLLHGECNAHTPNRL